MQTADTQTQTNIDARFLDFVRAGDGGGILVTCITFHANPFAVGSDGLDAMQLINRLPPVVEVVVDEALGLTMSYPRADLRTLIQDFRDMYHVAPQVNTLQ